MILGIRAVRRVTQASTIMPQALEKVENFENFFSGPTEADIASTHSRRQQSSGLPSVGIGLNFDPRREDGQLPSVRNNPD